MWQADISSETGGGKSSVDARKTDSDRRIWTISLATLMKGFYKFFSEEELEPDIKTHCMSFIVYCI